MNYTTIFQEDGFGAQYQRIIETYLFCKLHNLNFLYSPFTNIEHNYNNDNKFVNNIENFINLKNNILNTQDKSVKRIDYGSIVMKFINNNKDLCCKGQHLEFIKKCFWENKDKNVFKNNKLNVAIHIRRINKHDALLGYDNNIGGRATNDSYYLNIINIIRNKYINEDLQFHIYSQGYEQNFEIFKAPDTILHLNEELPLTFIGMVGADILVTSASSLSYTAALLSDGIIYYKTFWHNPRKEWIIC